jgi:hypothetical protein
LDKGAYGKKNHPGFNSDIKSPDERGYKAFNKDLLEKIRQDKEDKYCLVYLKQYVRYLKDHHSNIRGSSAPVDESKPDSVEAFFKSAAYTNTEIISADSLSLMRYFSNLAPASIEGIYITPDTTYKVAVLKDKENRNCMQ